MEQDQHPVVHDQFRVVLYRSPRQRESVSTIVIATNEMDGASSKTSEDLGNSIGPASMGEVAEMPNFILRSNHSVPPFDHGLVHLRGVRERTPAERNDVRVPEVMIRCEPDRHATTSSHSCRRSVPFRRRRNGTAASVGARACGRAGLTYDSAFDQMPKRRLATEPSPGPPPVARSGERARPPLSARAIDRVIAVNMAAQPIRVNHGRNVTYRLSP